VDVQVRAGCNGHGRMRIGIGADGPARDSRTLRAQFRCEPRVQWHGFAGRLGPWRSRWVKCRGERHLSHLDLLGRRSRRSPWHLMARSRAGRYANSGSHAVRRPTSSRPASESCAAAGSGRARARPVARMLRVALSTYSPRRAATSAATLIPPTTSAADATRRDGTRWRIRRRTYHCAPCHTTKPSILYPMIGSVPPGAAQESPESARRRCAIRDWSDHSSMKPGDACCENRPPDSPNEASDWS
jgi:hypothetical protein